MRRKYSNSSSNINQKAKNNSHFIGDKRKKRTDITSERPLNKYFFAII